MANTKRAYAENVPGDFFVDDTCIDCDLCRQIAPPVFREESDHSIVYRQPRTAAESHSAGMALVACPTGSIGTRRKLDLRPAVDAYPELIEDDVYFCGFASPNSYGASSYFIVRPEGNVLIDSPRFARSLVRQLEELGGVSLRAEWQIGPGTLTSISAWRFWDWRPSNDRDFTGLPITTISRSNRRC